MAITDGRTNKVRITTPASPSGTIQTMYFAWVRIHGDPGHPAGDSGAYDGINGESAQLQNRIARIKYKNSLGITHNTWTARPGAVSANGYKVGDRTDENGNPVAATALATNFEEATTICRAISSSSGATGTNELFNAGASTTNIGTGSWKYISGSWGIDTKALVFDTEHSYPNVYSPAWGNYPGDRQNASGNSHFQSFTNWQCLPSGKSDSFNYNTGNTKQPYAPYVMSTARDQIIFDESYPMNTVVIWEYGVNNNSNHTNHELNYSTGTAYVTGATHTHVDNRLSISLFYTRSKISDITQVKAHLIGETGNRPNYSHCMVLPGRWSMSSLGAYSSPADTQSITNSKGEIFIFSGYKNYDDAASTETSSDSVFTSNFVPFFRRYGYWYANTWTTVHWTEDDTDTYAFDYDYSAFFGAGNLTGSLSGAKLTFMADQYQD